MFNLASLVASPGRSGYLKSRVAWYTRPFLVVGAVMLLWTRLGSPSSWTDTKAWSSPTGVVTALTAILAVIAAAIDSLISPDAKATLVFWRWRDPLPGCRVFKPAIFDGDSRIDQARLRTLVGGSLPRGGGKSQNAAWYKLYKSVAQDTAVQGLHFEYLLFRDLTWLSLVLTILSLLNITVPSGAGNSFLAIGTVYAVLYFVFSQAARTRGNRFALQVLVAASTARPAEHHSST